MNRKVKRKNHLRAIFILNSFLHLLIASDAYAERAVTFRFNPPHGTALVETLEYSQSFEFGSMDLPPTKTTSKTRYVIRRTQTGYAVDATPIRPARLKKSDETMALLNSVISGLSLTYDLDANGKLLGIRGADKYFREVERQLPSGLLNVVTSAVYGKSQSVKQVVADVWRQKELTGFMVGETVELDARYRNRMVMPFFGGQEYEFTIQTQVSEFEDCGDLRPYCFYLRSDIKSTDTAYTDYLTDAIREMVIRGATVIAANEPSIDANSLKEFVDEVPRFRITQPEVTVTYERLMDLETGLSREISMQQSVSGLFAVGSEVGEPFIIRNKTYTSYEYE